LSAPARARYLIDTPTCTEFLPWIKAVERKGEMWRKTEGATAAVDMRRAAIEVDWRLKRFVGAPFNHTSLGRRGVVVSCFPT
jgi:hypothetical protein